MKTAKRKTKKAERVLNVQASPGRERDWQASDVDGANRTPADSVDLRNNWWGRAEDQGSTGACVGFAVGTVLHWHYQSNGLIPSHSTKHKPSYRFLWMASKETDRYQSFPTTMIDGSGTYIKNALEVARKFGVVEQRVFRMKDGTTDTPEKQFQALASKLKIKSYHAVSVYGDSHGFKGWDYWLTHEGPIVTRLDVDKPFLTANRRTPVLEQYRGGFYGGHAVVIAGYRGKDEDKQYLIKNSWGRRWGSDRGFQWVSEDYAKQAFHESYGVRV